MLDSSPISIPPPTRKLKRTASVASLPSPPPSVEHLKKRTTSQRFGSDSESGSENEVDEIAKDHKVIGRKLLFPADCSTSSRAEDADNPFMDEPQLSVVRERAAVSADSSPSTTPSAQREVAPTSLPPSKRKVTKASPPLPRNSPHADQRGRCSPAELPVLDEGNNPFLVDSRTKSRRPRSPRDLVEQPTMTYVFKGIKTTVPNPNYNLPESVYECSRLPLSHPDYSPLPMRAPKRLFPEAYPDPGNVEEDGEGSDGVVEGVDTDLRTPDKKPRMSKLFVDAAGNPLPDSGPQGVRAKTMDARDIGRMAVGPIRGRG
ncbi:hypothetical protein JB92DRAFT_2898700 [Gautieria morchelliformis]|nr:hypothetical protein JB92DRAFT_2898700 [Gautieria morchelliformis]